MPSSTMERNSRPSLEPLTSYEIKPKPTMVKNPQAKSIVERSHFTTAENLRTMNLSERTFDEDSIHAVLQNVAFGFRSTYLVLNS